MSLTEPSSATERLRTGLWVGAGGAVLAALAGMFGFHDASVWRLPRTLEAHVEAALQIAGYPGLDTEMQGQKAIVRGIVAEPGAVEIVRRTALHASGSGGPWAGGVTSVNTRNVTVGPLESPFSWRISRDGERIVLSGAAPSAPARAALMAAAAASFPNAERVDDMHVAGGAPAPNWTEMARSVVRAFALLSTGEARINDRRIAIIGDGPYDSVARLRDAYAAPAAPFQAVLAVSADGLDLDYPELQGVNLASGETDACNRAFARISERRAILFEPASSAIQAASLPALGAIASVALRCDRQLIEIAGPVDGGPVLSAQRAQAVAAQLVNAGVLRTSLRAIPGDGRAVGFRAVEAPR